ncbi:hypothetical protein Bxe_C0209 [Paraburkholderia xenovorans LB400]|uniref:Uncharacterized protein n=1 Tax=Paraburkholderia xenovorans (strain LB400) TaxID=266265 RepID=Q13IF6_PARXL|nr:hypothetical protein Bxe_C0209 [Paraburkholderia xenovorans LB400]
MGGDAGSAGGGHRVNHIGPMSLPMQRRMFAVVGASDSVQRRRRARAFNRPAASAYSAYYAFTRRTVFCVGVPAQRGSIRMNQACGAGPGPMRIGVSGIADRRSRARRRQWNRNAGTLARERSSRVGHVPCAPQRSVNLSCERGATMQTDPTVDPVADPANQPLDEPDTHPRPLPGSPPDTDPLAPGSSPEDEEELGDSQSSSPVQRD